MPIILLESDSVPMKIKLCELAGTVVIVSIIVLEAVSPRWIFSVRDGVKSGTCARGNMT